ncbi:DUF4783 domain-containing protein [Chitinophagaceae bacterium MMS25-I14]
MKPFLKRLFLVAVLNIICVSYCFSQNGTLKSIGNALSAGDASEVARYMDNVVDITINNNQSSYSRTQAEMVIRDFFNKNNPKNFEIERVGSPVNSTNTFSIGYLATANGRYRIYLFLKQKTSNYLLQEIRFEK